MPPQEDIFVEKNKINFKVLSSTMLNNWYWFVISLIICVFMSYLYLRYTAPIYKSTSRILIASDQSNTTAGMDALTQALGGKGSANTVEAEAEILKTKHLMEKVARDLKSYISYSHKGQLISVNLYKSSPFVLKIFGSPDSIKPYTVQVKMDGAKVNVFNEVINKHVSLYQPFILPNLGKVEIEPGIGVADKNATYIVQVSTIGQSVGALMKNIEVNIPVKLVDIIALTYTNPLPKFGEDVLSKLIDEYIKSNIDDKNKIADSTIAFIDNRLIYVSQELGHIEGDVQNFKQENKIADIAAQSTLLITSTGDYNTQHDQADIKLSVLNSIEKFLLDAGPNQRIVPSGALLEDPSFAALVDRYNTIVLAKEKASLSQTEDNPYMQGLNGQIAGAKQDMLSSLRSLKKSLTITKSKIDARSGALSGQVHKVPAVERKYLDLTRQQEIKQTLYVFLLQKREETAISKTSNISSCKIIEPPLSEGPISPIRTNVMAYGVIFGLFLPFAIIFLRSSMDSRISSKEQVAGLTQVAIIGELGKGTMEDGSIVVSQGSRTPISEQFRSLRTNLAFFLSGNEKTILMTSSMSGEGKSFIALNLATAIAISGKKVVVMEMDLRKPNLSNKLKITNDVGFTNYIVSPEIKIADIIKPSGTNSNLFLISSGNIPPNPTEIILNSRTDTLMDSLVHEFDYIIIDAPPIGMVTDAQLLSKYADLTLYVVRQGFTIKDQLDIPQEIYRNKKMKNIAILMNDVKNDSAYGYGYGYGIDLEKKGFFARIFNK
ncbi:tyrosine-protein kinase [Pedobacter sp. L105]|uniref:GumC family protein n=1 Tax=Pedobacter sp. L105 TaxID=1641871 RepID=UPI00131BA39F|nr:tyrosine-protein kinase [Pedobacter sp. L105]